MQKPTKSVFPLDILGFPAYKGYVSKAIYNIYHPQKRSKRLKIPSLLQKRCERRDCWVCGGVGIEDMEKIFSDLEQSLGILRIPIKIWSEDQNCSVLTVNTGIKIDRLARS